MITEDFVSFEVAKLLKEKGFTQGVMNFFGSIDYNKETIAKLAVEQADALIAELRKEV